MHQPCGHSVHILNDVGNRRPLAGSALGVAILLALRKGEQRAVLLRNRKELRRNPAHRERAYDAMWQRSRDLGFGANLGDVIPGIGSVGVPILDQQAHPLVAIGRHRRCGGIHTVAHRAGGASVARRGRAHSERTCGPYC